MKMQIFKTKRDFKKKNLKPNQDLYWKLLIGMVLILSIAFASFGYHLFYRIKIEPASTDGNVPGGRIIKKERLDKALEYFSEREKTSAAILNSRPPVVDPSL